MLVMSMVTTVSVATTDRTLSAIYGDRHSNDEDKMIDTTMTRTRMMLMMQMTPPVSLATTDLMEHSPLSMVMGEDKDDADDVNDDNGLLASIHIEHSPLVQLQPRTATIPDQPKPRTATPPDQPKPRTATPPDC